MAAYNHSRNNEGTNKIRGNKIEKRKANEKKGKAEELNIHTYSYLR